MKKNVTESGRVSVPARLRRGMGVMGIMGVLGVMCFLGGCTTPYVVGISRTQKYVSGVWDVTDSTVWGVGSIGGPYGGGVVGYCHTIVRTAATGETYRAALRERELEMLR